MQKTSFTSRIAGLATLALAALPMAALSTAAHAAPAVKVGDLNLMSAEGEAALQQRVGVATHKFCAQRKTISDRRACDAGVRAELAEKADAVRQAQFAQRSVTFAAR